MSDGGDRTKVGQERHLGGRNVRGPHRDCPVGVSQAEDCRMLVLSHRCTRSQLCPVLGNNSACGRILILEVTCVSLCDRKGDLMRTFKDVT